MGIKLLTRAGAQAHRPTVPEPHFDKSKGNRRKRTRASGDAAQRLLLPPARTVIFITTYGQPLRERHFRVLIIEPVVFGNLRGGPTFGRRVPVELSEENRQPLWVPRGFPRAGAVLPESVDFFYKCDKLYSPSDDFVVRCDDPTFECVGARCCGPNSRGHAPPSHPRVCLTLLNGERP
jgi:dTDP-4-dehydrorhamnose 3,5-epimerase